MDSSRCILSRNAGDTIMIDTIKYKGKIIITEESGKQYVFKNIVTDGFYQLIADNLIGASSDNLTHFGIGTGTTTATGTDTSLVTPSGDREAITYTDSTGAIIHLRATISGADLIYTWKEVGVFTALTAGIMTNRVNINYVHNAGESITIDYYIEKE